MSEGRLSGVIRELAHAGRLFGISMARAGWVLRQVFGDVSWQAPAWFLALAGAIRRGCQALAQWVNDNRKRAAWTAAAGVLILVAAMGGKWWYDKLPKPVEVAFTLTPPGRTPIENPNAKPDPIVLSFASSVAPLAGLSTPLKSGIEISPRAEGSWVWTDDRTLKFLPRNDWPIDTEFTVDLAKRGLAAEHIRLAKHRSSFRTASFIAKLTEAQFYQDPVDPAAKKVVATVTFSHPVDVASFEKRIVVREEGKSTGFLGFGAATSRFRVTYDTLKLNAYIHSDALPIPAKPSRVDVVIEAGVRALRGGNETPAPLTRIANVPGLYSLSVSSTELTQADNERLEPDRILMVKVSMSTHEREVAPKVRAWLLPVRHPDPKLQSGDEPYSWGDPAQIGPEILKLSEAVKLDQVPAEREHVEQHAFKVAADAGRFLYVRVDKGIKSFGGYVLEKDYDAIVEVEPFPRQLRIASQGSLLALSGEKKIAVLARDVEGLRYDIGRLVPKQLQHLVTMTHGTFSEPSFNGEFDEENLTERHRKIEALPAGPAGKPHYLTLDLARYLAPESGPRRGIFFVKVESYDPKTKETTGASDRRLIVVTDLGIVAKQAIDGTQDVFVQSIATGQPVPGATIEVIAKNGLAVVHAVTDASGRARLPGLSGFDRERAPVLYLATKGGDSSFLPMNRSDRALDFSRFDIGGVASSADAGKLSAYLFSDRGIYRPGEEIRVGMIVKAVDWTRAVAGLPLEVELTDSRGLVLRRDKLKLGAGGLEEFRHTTLETAPTGNYTVALHIVKDGQRAGQLGAVVVKVQEFMPDRLKMTARLTREAIEGWVSPQDLKARVQLQNLFGTPAENRRVTAAMTLAPSFPVFPSWREYQFHDPHFAKEGHTEQLADGKTNEKGEAEFDLSLGRFARATYRLHLVAQGFEPDGGRGVSAETAMLVSSMPYLVGYKPDGDLGYVSRGSARSVELIAIDPAAKLIEVKELKLVRVERRFVSVLTKQSNGTYRYQSREKRITLDEQPLNLPARGMKLALAADAPGSYAYVVRDAQGQDLARIQYEVAGAANLTRSLEKNAELQVKLDRKDYAAGGEIEVSIQAPYVGAGLITLERERVFAHSWFKTSTTSSTQKIKLPADFEGNGYVTVTFIRDPGSDEIYASPLAYGVQAFSVNLDRRRIKATVQAPDLVKPGDTLRMRYSTERPARMVVFAVDEGILQVARYRTADPLGFFFQKRALEVRTSQILDLILPEFRRFMAAAAPGGDADGALGKHLNPFKRKRDKPVAYWSGVLESGPQERELTWQVPDSFNGTLRIMAVAVTEDAIGVFEKKTLVRGDFVLSPNLPTTLTPGDEFDVSVGVSNNVAGSGTEAQLTVALSTSSHLEVVGEPTVKLKVGELREGVTSFRVRVRDELGSASLTFTASLDKRSARIAADVSVRPAQPYFVELAAGSVRAGAAESAITRNLYPQYRKLEASVSYVPLALAQGLTSYLANFPYSCTEQLVSMGMPALVLSERSEFGQVKTKDARAMESLISVLRTRQNADGAFALWAANSHVDVHASVYAMHFLVEARERGRAVPPDMLAAGNNWLRSLAATEGTTLADERARAYAVYVLTRQGVVTTNFASALQKRLEASHAKTYVQDMAAAHLAASYQLMKQQRLADRLIGDMRMGAPAEVQLFHDGLSRDAQLLYLIARHFPERLPRVRAEALESLVKRIGSGSYNTYSSAHTILALEAYTRIAEKLPADSLAASEVLRDGKTRTLALPPVLIPRVPFTPDAARIRFENKADLSAYWMVEQSGFERGVPDKEIKNGLEVIREYVDTAGKPLRSIKVGDEVEVRLKFRALGSQAIGNVALVDLLPGGFDLVLNPREPEPVASEQGEKSESGSSASAPAWRPRFGTNASTWVPEFADLREDRVVLYGTVRPEIQEFVYRIKATNTGAYTVPPAYGESLYERALRARSLGAKLTVEKR